MPVETATYIDDLNTANPVGASDPKSQGDDHLRLLKAVLKASLPGLTKPWYFVNDNIEFRFAADPEDAFAIWPLIKRTTGGAVFNLDGQDGSEAIVFREAGNAAGSVIVQSNSTIPGSTIEVWFTGGLGSPIKLAVGRGSPEGVVSGTKGSLYLREDGGAGTCFYVKEGASGSTGWVAK